MLPQHARFCSLRLQKKKAVAQAAVDQNGIGVECTESAPLGAEPGSTSVGNTAANISPGNQDEEATESSNAHAKNTEGNTHSQQHSTEIKGNMDPLQSALQEQTDKPVPAATLEPSTSTPGDSNATTRQNTGEKVIESDAGGSEHSSLHIAEPGHRSEQPESASMATKADKPSKNADTKDNADSAQQDLQEQTDKQTAPESASMATEADKQSTNADTKDNADSAQQDLQEQTDKQTAPESASMATEAGKQSMNADTKDNADSAQQDLQEQTDKQTAPESASMATEAGKQSMNAGAKGNTDPSQSTSQEQTDKPAPAATLEPSTSTPVNGKGTTGQKTGEVIESHTGASDSSDLEVMYVKKGKLTKRQQRLLRVKQELEAEPKLEPTTPIKTEHVDKGQEPKGEKAKREVKEEPTAG